MRARRFDWEGAAATAAAIRGWSVASSPAVDVAPIEREVAEGGDEAVLRLTARLDAPESPPAALRVEPGEAVQALETLDPAVREAMAVAAAQVWVVAVAHVGQHQRTA